MIKRIIILLKNFIKEERTNLKQCLVDAARKKEDQIFRDAAIFGRFQHPRPCMNRWANKVESHIHDKSKHFAQHFPLIGTYKSDSEKVKENLRSYSSDSYKQGTELRDLRGLLIPMVNPYLFQSK